MTVSVVIPVRSDRAGLAATCAALARQTRCPDQVVVVDSASEPPVSSVPLDVPGVEVVLVRTDVPGSYRARNAGLEHVRGDVVVFTDADCVPADDYVARVVARFATVPPSRPVAFGGRIDVAAADPSRPSLAESYELLEAFPQRTYVETRNFAATANLVVNRAAMETAGPFDEHLRSGGDVEWGARAVRSGVVLRYADELVVSHPARATMRALLAKRWRTIQGDDRLRREGRGGREYSLVRLAVPPVRSYVSWLRSGDHPPAVRWKAVAAAQVRRWATIVFLLRLRARPRG